MRLYICLALGSQEIYLDQTQLVKDKCPHSCSLKGQSPLQESNGYQMILHYKYSGEK
jgi:hypothetical protein